MEYENTGCDTDSGNAAGPAWALCGGFFVIPGIGKLADRRKYGEPAGRMLTHRSIKMTDLPFATVKLSANVAEWLSQSLERRLLR